MSVELLSLLFQDRLLLMPLSIPFQRVPFAFFFHQEFLLLRDEVFHQKHILV